MAMLLEVQESGKVKSRGVRNIETHEFENLSKEEINNKIGTIVMELQKLRN